jgi:hypothetical protein
MIALSRAARKSIGAALPMAAGAALAAPAPVREHARVDLHQVRDVSFT